MNFESRSLVRAVRGPVIMITVGVLFAFDTMSDIRFSQTWPVLLIVIGLLSLAGGGRLRKRDRINTPAGVESNTVEGTPGGTQ